MRFRVEPRDVSPEAAARRIGLSPARFDALLPELECRGFPRADATTGNYDLDAIDEWRRRRNPHLFGDGTPASSVATHAGTVVKARLRSAPWAGSK
jgi:hypothetical protein